MNRPAALLLALALAAGAAQAAPPAPVERARLLARAEALAELRERARRGEANAPQVLEQLVAFADTLESAGLDSAAAITLYRAGGMSGRLARGGSGEDLLRRALQLAMRAREDRLQVRVRILLASQVANRDPAQSVQLLLPVESLCLRQKEWTQLARARNTLSTCYGAMGRMSDAMRAARGSLDAAERARSDRERSAAHGELCQMLIPQGRAREALMHADSAVASAKRVGVSLELARAYGFRARALQANGRSREALAMHRDALTIDRIRDDRQHMMRTRLALGQLHWDLGQYREALGQADSLLEGARRARNRLLESRALALRTVTLADLGRIAEAETTLARAVPSFEGIREGLGDAGDQAGLALRGGEMYATWARCLAAQGRIARAWRVTERGRAWALREQIADDDSLVTLQAVQALLRECDGALLQWTENQRNPGLAFVVTADSVIAVHLGRPQTAGPGNAAIAAIESGAAETQFRLALQTVSRAWLQPLLARVPARTQRLMLATNGALTGLPIEELPMADGRPLGDRWPTTHVPSASAWMLLVERDSPPSGMAVFADPALEPNTLAALERRAGVAVRDLARRPLPQARIEARRVAGAGAAVWLGGEANRARLTDAARARDAVLHFATHAWVDASDPDAGGLVLAGNDGLVTSADITALRLPADLVVLSGCETARGEDVLGEGVLGLTRAFLLAGGRSVVSTRWAVRDAAARRAMELFYAGLRAGQPRDEALQRTRAQMVREKFPVRDRAAFSLLGVGHEPVRSLRGR